MILKKKSPINTSTFLDNAVGKYMNMQRKISTKMLVHKCIPGCKVWDLQSRQSFVRVWYILLAFYQTATVCFLCPIYSNSRVFPLWAVPPPFTFPSSLLACCLIPTPPPVWWEATLWRKSAHCSSTLPSALHCLRSKMISLFLQNLHLK